MVIDDEAFALYPAVECETPSAQSVVEYAAT
jgi:hypothetical protein